MIHWPANWNTPGEVGVLLASQRAGGAASPFSANALEPNWPPLSVFQPSPGSLFDVVAMAIWFPQVVPVVNAKKEPPANTMSGSGASRANAGPEAGVTLGVTGLAEAAGLVGPATVTSATIKAPTSASSGPVARASDRLAGRRCI